MPPPPSPWPPRAPYDEAIQYDACLLTISRVRASTAGINNGHYDSGCSGGSGGCVVLAEVGFIDAAGTLLSVGGVTSSFSGADSERSLHLIADGSAMTYWSADSCCRIGQATITFAFSAPTTIGGYQLTTGGYSSARDPTAWALQCRVQGSQLLVELDRHSSASPPLERQTEYGLPPFISLPPGTPYALHHAAPPPPSPSPPPYWWRSNYPSPPPPAPWPRPPLPAPGAGGVGYLTLGDLCAGVSYGAAPVPCSSDGPKFNKYDGRMRHVQIFDVTLNSFISPPPPPNAPPSPPQPPPHPPLAPGQTLTSVPSAGGGAAALSRGAIVAIVCGSVAALVAVMLVGLRFRRQSMQLARAQLELTQLRGRSIKLNDDHELSSAQMGNEPEPTLRRLSGGDEAAAEGAEIAMTTLPQLMVTDVIKSRPKTEPEAP